MRRRAGPRPDGAAAASIGMVWGVIMVSTDGSCLKNPGGAIGWAWVDHRGEAHSGGAPSGTNQIAELRAILEAVTAHPGDEPLMIESDSQYAIKCATEWLPGWKKRGWKTASGTPVKNVDLVRAIDAALAARPGPVRFRWVRGHVGNEFNEMADSLAGKAARAARDGKITPTPPPVIEPPLFATEPAEFPEPPFPEPAFPEPAAPAEPSLTADDAAAAAVAEPAAAARPAPEQPALFPAGDDELTLF